jgi:hypothetical protein
LRGFSEETRRAAHTMKRRTHNELHTQRRATYAATSYTPTGPGNKLNPLASEFIPLNHSDSNSNATPTPDCEKCTNPATPESQEYALPLVRAPDSWLEKPQRGLQEESNHFRCGISCHWTRRSEEDFCALVHSCWERLPEMDRLPPRDPRSTHLPF